MSDNGYQLATRPEWIHEPNLDAPCGPNLQPLSWPYWTDEERGRYVNQIAFGDAGPDWEPPHPVCNGCDWDRPDWRWMLRPHPNGGWWHAATCMPPDNWPGFPPEKQAP